MHGQQGVQNPNADTEVAAGAEQRCQMEDRDEMLKVAEVNDKAYKYKCAIKAD
jgi:hypothetical protein